MYLIDANVLIDANDYFYPIDRIPQFWSWLVDQGEAGNVKIAEEIYHEISGTGSLPTWLKQGNVKDALLLDEQADPLLVQRALNHGYQAEDPRFHDGELEKIGRDAFLVAYGLANHSRVIVTREVSKRTKRLGSSKLPDACDDCAVRWTTDYELYKLLDFNLRGR